MSVTITKLALVDDHHLFRKGLMNLIHSLNGSFKVVYEAENGKKFLDLLQTHPPPDIAILDLEMPELSGYETARILRERYPQMPVLIISMVNNEITLIKMLTLGVKGVLGKDVEPEELLKALKSIRDNGFYYTDYLTGKMIETYNQPKVSSLMNEKLEEFLRLAGTEMTYKEIADKMNLSVKTIDGYRNTLFEKLNVKSRVGLALYAVRHKIIEL